MSADVSRNVGEAGVSTISSAAGRNARSAGLRGLGRRGTTRAIAGCLARRPGGSDPGHRRLVGLGQEHLGQADPAALRPGDRAGADRRRRSLALADPSWVRRQIGVVLQKNVLFNRTARENIALADPGMSMERRRCGMPRASSRSSRFGSSRMARPMRCCAPAGAMRSCGGCNRPSLSRCRRQ